MGSPISSGVWTVQLAGRGGSPLRMEVPFTSLSRRKSLNDTGSISVQIPAGDDAADICCAAFASTEPWRDEIVAYRDDDLDFAGPIVTQTISPGGGRMEAPDLFAWMDQRFLEHDFFAEGDLAQVFERVFDLAYALDTTPNIAISARDCGVRGVRRFDGREFRPAGQVMRELARTALDFTVIGRTIVAGGTEIFIDAAPLMLHDAGVTTAEVTRDGSSFATDVAVFGGTSNTDAVDSLPAVVATGRAVRASERYGLVQRSYTELFIKDSLSADANARARLEAMQPAPIRVSATLSPDAAFTYDALVPGKRFDVRLAQVPGCIEVMQAMRLTEVSIDVGPEGERIQVELVPLGESEQEA